MRKRGARKGQWIFWVVAFFGWFAPAGVLATSENLLVNGNFSANQGGWVGANGGASCSGGSPSLGIWGGGPQLTFSYMQNSVSQQVTISSPSALELSFLANGPNGGTYSATISDSDESVTTGVLTAGANQVSNLRITTTQNNEVVTVTFAGKDALFWAGCYGPVIRNASLTVVTQPTSLVVTSLLDDGSVGTLRWAIIQANATAGGIYDAIDITTEGTITLTSDLPAITAGVTITGTGMATTIIDGNNLNRAIYNNGSRTIVVQDMTFKQGKNVSWNGGLIYNSNGTMTFNRIKISNHSSWAFYQGNGGVTTFNDSQFTNNGYAITSDHGGTPSSLSLTDTNYSNRIYINNSVFTSNTYGIRTERFTKVVDSQFTNNTYGALLGGLNRQQVINSTFTSNNVGVYLSSWIPTSWTPGAGNQTVSNNAFNGNTTAIQFANNWNNGSSMYNGVSANSFSTASGNIFGTTALNTNNFSGAGYVESNNTTTAAYLNPVTNLTAVANADGSVDLDWDASAASNTAIYGYSVSFYDLDEIGGTTSGGWGVSTNQGTTYSLSTGMFSGSNPVTTGYGPVRFGIKAGNQSCFNSAGVGPCVYGPEITVDVTVLDPTPPTTTTTEVPTTTTEPPTTTTTEVPEIEEPTTTELPVTLPPDTEPEDTIVTTPDTTDGGTDGGTGDSDDTTSPETTVPESAPEEETPDTTPELPVEEETPEAVVDDILAGDPSPEELADAVSDALSATESEEELVSVATELLTSDLDTEQFIAVIDEVFSQDLSDEALAELVTTVFAEDLSDEEIAAVVDQVFTADISDEAFAEVLDTIFEEPLSDEAFDSVIDAILDEPISDAAFDELVDVLGGDSVSDEQVVAAVDAIIENGLSEAQSVSIATSGEVLESITGDQASEIFATVPIGDISDAEAAALVEAVQDAPTEVKEAFEEEINIFAAGNVDTYVPLGSSIPVSTRRVLIAGTALTLTMIPIPVQVSPSRSGK
jgi:hypothetical protein